MYIGFANKEISERILIRVDPNKRVFCSIAIETISHSRCEQTFFASRLSRQDIKYCLAVENDVREDIEVFSNVLHRRKK